MSLAAYSITVQPESRRRLHGTSRVNEKFTIGYVVKVVIDEGHLEKPEQVCRELDADVIPVVACCHYTKRFSVDVGISRQIEE
ncbi:hypothetical protein P3T76_002621 [Phytophthora citrophthora]|uniref:Uncharacterized protein n=1 Tax=Phytophthora citrophthora TaxID=4793 RepID=A0AAD9GWZ2_9STRA|nr:hypothetical protein P3T76_002621 [Phytophthora citrophthora]